MHFRLNEAKGSQTKQFLWNDGYVLVYTDGSRAQHKAGIGVWFNTGHPL